MDTVVKPVRTAQPHGTRLRAQKSRPVTAIVAVFRGSLPSRLASIGLLVVLIALPGFALWGAAATHRTGVAVRHATDLSNIFEQARYAVEEEESLERKYRLEPGDAVRALHRAAGEAMLVALKQAAATAPQADLLVIESVLARHAEYIGAISRMFAAVDINDTAAATAIDSAEVDPSFDAIETQVVALSDKHRVDAAEHLDALAVTQDQVLLATPVVFALGAILVIFFWRVMFTYKSRLDAGLAREAANTRASEQRFRGLVQNTSDVILICTSPGTVTYQSPAAEANWGYAAGQLLGEPLMKLVHVDDQAALRGLWEQLQQAVMQGDEVVARTTELQLCDGAGSWRRAELIATNLLNDPAVQGLVITIRDVTERKAFEQQLTQQAFYDALTKLPNRVLFRDRLQQALVRAGRRKAAVGLVFVDLDNFKLVNDSLGHLAGDELLVETAARLRACVRAQDTVARLGGDEFAVILELVAGKEDAVTVAKSMIHQFSRPLLLDGREVVVTASMGIAISDAGPEHAENLLRDADVAMYRAKSDGRARYVVFDQSMHTDSLARLELETDLRHAMDHHELRVHYQPIVSIETGWVTEVEALVRWQHPVRGLVAPVEFISVAEETGLIIPLGSWVLEQACLQVVAWHKLFASSPPITLSVNLSPRQFQQPSLVAEITRALSDSGLPASCLKLEITEGALMRDVEATIRTLWQLKDLGLQLAVDDFGTGYSSLSYLKRLPVDVLKIDRSFVQGIGTNPEDSAIVQATISLAKSLHLTITGEGIETTQQADLLAEWGCDRGQGYLYSKPLDGKTAEEFLAAALRQTTEAGRATHLVNVE